MPSSAQGRYRLGVDIGGTFTDVVLVSPDGEYWTKKVSSTPGDYALGILEGVRQLLSELGLVGESIDEIIHGTTVASNTVLENKGAKTALITTLGFRDVLELRRLRIPHLYSLFYQPPKPLAERRLRLEVKERIGADGEVVTPLDESTIYAAIDRIKEDGAESVAVCFIHSYRNPNHERRVGEILHQELPGVFTSLSIDVLSEIREYERTSTTVVNAYLGPIVKGYIDSLLRQLRESGIHAPVRIMQSNGGVMSAIKAADAPVHIVESGPAAGVVAADQVGKRSGETNIISFDMGGTTAKASLIEDGQLSWTTEHEIGAGISLSSRLVKGGGHAVKVPVVDLAEVGAGGGSIVWIDRGGALKVGPQSAGAMPGPVCYGTGGEEPTVTDANVVLGYISPEKLAGGAVELKPEIAEEILQQKVAEPLGTGLLETAYGIHTVANITMMRAIRAVSTYRGRDPRDFALLAFGGSGPVHAAGIARDLGIRRVIVPPAPGLLSAVGLLEALPEYHFVQTFFSRVSEVDPDALHNAYKQLESRAIEALKAEGYDDADIELRRSADLRYVGQAYELTVDAPAGRLTAADVVSLVAVFHDEHERTYGHKAPGEPVEIVNLRSAARGKTDLTRPERPATGGAASRGQSRDAYFGPDHGRMQTPILSRSDLNTVPRHGPIVIDEYDATVVVPPDCAASLDQWNNIIIDVVSK